MEADSSETLPLTFSLISQQTQPQLIHMLRDSHIHPALRRKLPVGARPARADCSGGESKNVELLTLNTSEAKLMRHESTSAALKQ